MDSHGSASPISPTLTGATSRSAGGVAVTRRRQTGPPEIPEFRDVTNLPDGTWTAVHKASGDVITAASFDALEGVEAPQVRLLHAWRRSS
ncbi:hypothetical protein [Nonomuraea basaltis]|uniref:hypothetical protein n=1 Tax=Nonomuraea basaltis TaxID=2495887 RepID=UPI00110C5836|nr:hypothetical protein [Nonomuraea basaltis]TMR90368.1 hypothetical protein EJK15_55685 [Nonomuraea basaltis]